MYPEVPCVGIAYIGSRIGSWWGDFQQEYRFTRELGEISSSGPDCKEWPSTTPLWVSILMQTL